jgi:hypothetical protein
VMEGISLEGDEKRALQFHVQCLAVWDERRQLTTLLSARCVRSASLSPRSSNSGFRGRSITLAAGTICRNSPPHLGPHRTRPLIQARLEQRSVVASLPGSSSRPDAHIRWAA